MNYLFPNKCVSLSHFTKAYFTGSVAYVLHFVPVFCPPKKRTKELVFSEKKKPYASRLTREKWQ